MSIIYDALHKIQKSRVNVVDTSKEKKKWLKTHPIDILLSVMIGSLLIVLLMTQILPRIGPSAKKISALYSFTQNKLFKPPVAVAPASAPVVPKSIINEVEFKRTHILNGVFISDHEKVALINNRFFNIGDMVDGVKIIDMNSDHIKLQNEQVSFTLRVMV